MTILNLHGFVGGADNKNYQALCGLFPPEQITAPQLDYIRTAPDALLTALEAMLPQTDSVLLVGQSIGGFFADQLSRRTGLSCILTNPAYAPHTLRLIAESGMPDAFLSAYAAMSPQKKNLHSYVLCSDADTLIPDNLRRCRTLGGFVRTVHGSHGTIKDLPEQLAALLEIIRTETSEEDMQHG